jgi:hypothetical protein
MDLVYLTQLLSRFYKLCLRFRFIKDGTQLKKLLFIVVIGLGVFQHFSKSSMADEPVINAPH